MKAVIPPHSSLLMPGWTHDRWRPTSHWGLIALGKNMEDNICMYIIYTYMYGSPWHRQVWYWSPICLVTNPLSSHRHGSFVGWYTTLYCSTSRLHSRTSQIRYLFLIFQIYTSAHQIFYVYIYITMIFWCYTKQEEWYDNIMIMTIWIWWKPYDQW